MRKDLARRLKHICEDLSRADFDALVMSMTVEQMRGESINHSRLRPC